MIKFFIDFEPLSYCGGKFNERPFKNNILKVLYIFILNEWDKRSNRVSNDYGAEQIQVLEGLEPVRKRPGMYIGSTGPRLSLIHI